MPPGTWMLLKPTRLRPQYNENETEKVTYLVYYGESHTLLTDPSDLQSRERMSLQQKRDNVRALPCLFYTPSHSPSSVLVTWSPPTRTSMQVSTTPFSRLHSHCPRSKCIALLAHRPTLPSFRRTRNPLLTPVHLQKRAPTFIP